RRRRCLCGRRPICRAAERNVLVKNKGVSRRSGRPCEGCGREGNRYTEDCNRKPVRTTQHTRDPRNANTTFTDATKRQYRDHLLCAQSYQQLLIVRCSNVTSAPAIPISALLQLDVLALFFVCWLPCRRYRWRAIIKFGFGLFSLHCTLRRPFAGGFVAPINSLRPGFPRRCEPNAPRDIDVCSSDVGRGSLKMPA